MHEKKMNKCIYDDFHILLKSWNSVLDMAAAESFK